MSPISRGFMGRRRPRRGSVAGAARAVRDETSRCSRRDPRRTLRSRVEFTIDGAVDSRRVVVGGVQRAAAGDVHGRHPLRDEVVKARYRLAGRVGGHAAPRVQTEAEYVTAFSDGGYTTNLPLADVTGGRAWVAYAYGGEPLEPEHGGPARLLVPHLYFWKSAKWVRGLKLTVDDGPASGRATGTTITAIRGKSSATRGTDLAAGDGGELNGDRTRREHRAGLPDWPGHRPGQHVDVRLTAEDGYQTQRSYSIASAPEDDT